MPNKPIDPNSPNANDELSFEERVAQHKSRLAQASSRVAEQGTHDGAVSFDIEFDNADELVVGALPKKHDFSTLKRSGVRTDQAQLHAQQSQQPQKTEQNQSVVNTAVSQPNTAQNGNQNGVLNNTQNQPTPQPQSPQPQPSPQSPIANQKEVNQSNADDKKTIQNQLVEDDKEVTQTTKQQAQPPKTKVQSAPKQDDTAKPAYIRTKPVARPANVVRVGDILVSQVALSDKKLSKLQIASIMAVSLLLVTWLKQDRLADYWQQTYQTGEPWTTLAGIGVWQSGEKVGHLMGIGGVNAGLADVGGATKDWLNNALFAEKIAQEKAKKAAELAEMERIAKETAIQQKAQAEAIRNEPRTKITLRHGQKVFFAGDSMMQGVAPWVMRKLSADYHIDSIDLSKQSTGLSYSSFFDWPATIEKTFADNTNIGALVVFLGANDPWAVPNPANKAAKYIDFGTDEWTTLYHQKMQRILDNAKSHNAQVIWVTPPTMKKPKLNEQMAILTDIMHKGIDKTQVVLMDARPLLSPDDNYTDTITLDGKTVKVRTADGIHFTVDGQKHLANHILSKIEVLP